MPHKVHLVGSVPLADAATVFTEVSAVLGGLIDWMPDGEVGRPWMGWLQPVFNGHPQLEPTGEAFRPHPGASYESRRLRLRDGATGADLRFDTLRHAEVACASYAIFRRLRDAGTVPAGCRFLMPIATPAAPVNTFVDPAHQRVVVAAYEAAVIGQIARMVAAIPPSDLVVQWDVAHEMTTIERGEPSVYGADRDAMIEAFGAALVRLGQAVPAAVGLIYHLCYGDSGHRHTIEPASTAAMVAVANRVSRDIGRTIDLFHMPVPRDRDDDAYFAPLADLRLRPETRLSFGLVHRTGGVAGTRRRMARAHKYVDDFYLGTECGFGRRPPETIAELLRIHAEAAA